MTENKSNLKKYAILAILFAFFYFLLYALTFFGEALSKLPVLDLFFPLSQWDSPLYWLMPVVGFFIIYLLIDYVKKEFETSFLEKAIFPIFYFLISLLAFYVNLFFYFSSMVGERKIFICLFDCQNVSQQLIAAGKAQEIFFLEFWPQFRASAFFPFVLAGVFAWLTYYILKKLKAKNFF